MSHDLSENGKWASTYFMSNIAMQSGRLNQGLWVAIEKRIMDWIERAKAGDKGLFIVTGTAFRGAESAADRRRRKKGSSGMFGMFGGGVPVKAVAAKSYSKVDLRT